MIKDRMSCVMPAYNAARTIRSALISALTQTRPLLEIIVVDDGSTDATADVVAKLADPRIRLVSQANAGPAAARNAGIAAARGEWVGFLDSDDLWLPTYVERATGAMNAVPNPGFAYTDAHVFRADSGRVRRSTAMNAPDPAPAGAESFLIAVLRRNFVFTAATIPARVLSAVGGYDERLRLAEEYDLWLRILAAGFDPIWMGGPLALYREHAGQSSHQILLMKQAVSDVYARLSMEAMPSDAARQVLLERRAAAGREVAIASGTAGLASLGRRLRHALGSLRRRAGLTHRFHPTPPHPIPEVFGDLRSIDDP
jgi:glycosyltransferase involved in cell wall biosynthesis